MCDRVDGTFFVPSLTGHTGRVTSVAVGRAGNQDIIVSGSEDTTVRIWDVVTGAQKVLTGHTDKLTSVAMGRISGRDVIVSGSGREVRIWDASASRLLV